MITMVDQIYDRDYQAARTELNRAIGTLARKVRSVFAPALSGVYHFEWDAPWNVKPSPKAKA
jgi:hypothetical protein